MELIFVICAVVLLLMFIIFSRNSRKTKVGVIIKGFLQILYDDSEATPSNSASCENKKKSKTKKVSIVDLFLFYFWPLLVSITFFIYTKKMNIPEIHIVQLYSTLLTIMSIFTGLLFTFIALTFEINNPTSNNQIKKAKLELHKGICYAILVSVLIVLMLFFDLFIFVRGKISAMLFIVIWTLSIHFFLILLLILKRIYIIFVTTSD